MADVLSFRDSWPGPATQRCAIAGRKLSRKQPHWMTAIMTNRPILAPYEGSVLKATK